MSDYHRETKFLRQCIRYDETMESRQLDKNITELERDERCLHRAACLMALLLALAMAGLCYAAIFLVDSQTVSRPVTQLIIKLLCELGLGSLICLAAFLGLGAAQRRKLDHRREGCRNLTGKFLESRFGAGSERFQRKKLNQKTDVPGRDAGENDHKD